MNGPARLTCSQCKLRKKKCNKSFPCSACEKAGLQCSVVRRARLPRGRSGKQQAKSARLEDRVARIEALLSQAPRSLTPNSGAETSSSTISSQSGTNDKDSGKDSASDIWTALANEVSGLRDTIEDSDGENEDKLISNEPTVSALSADFGAILLNQQTQSTGRNDASAFIAHVKPFLLEIYKFRIDAIFKLFHWPTLVRDLESLANGSAVIKNADSLHAMELAICFMAICSLTGEECHLSLNADRNDLLRSMKQEMEKSLARLRLMQNPDMYGLQAFVLYVTALRTSGHFATSWTLLALAMRMAIALGLDNDREDLSPSSPIEWHVRRRVWYCLNALDTQCTLDRGSASLVSSKLLGPLPLNLNDEDVGEGSSNITNNAVTDMTFPLVTFEAMTCQKRISELAEQGAASWERRATIVRDFQHSVTTRYANRCDPTVPLGRLTILSAQKTCLTMDLLLRRPPFRQKRYIPPGDDFDIMLVGTEICEGHLTAKQPDLSPWACKEWIPWYVLAVLLAELLRNPEHQGASRAFRAAQGIYSRYARPLNDPESGMIWKPITRLMRRITRERHGEAYTGFGMNRLDISLNGAPASQDVNGCTTDGTHHNPNVETEQFNTAKSHPVGSSTGSSWPSGGLHPMEEAFLDDFLDLDMTDDLGYLDWNWIDQDMAN